MEGGELIVSIIVALLLIPIIRGILAGAGTPMAIYVPDGGYNSFHHPYIPGVPAPTHHTHRHHHKHGGHPNNNKTHHGRHHGHPGHHSGRKIPTGATYGEYIPVGRTV